MNHPQICLVGSGSSTAASNSICSKVFKESHLRSLHCLCIISVVQAPKQNNNNHNHCTGGFLCDYKRGRARIEEFLKQMFTECLCRLMHMHEQNTRCTLKVSVSVCLSLCIFMWDEKHPPLPPPQGCRLSCCRPDARLPPA